MRTPLKLLVNLLELVEVAMCIAGMVAILALVSANVFMRYVLNAPLAWTHEVIMYTFIITSLLGISVGYRRQRHLHLHGIAAFLPDGGERALKIAVNFVILALLIYLTSKAVDLNALYQRFSSPLNHMPRAWLTMGLIWSFVSMSLTTVYFIAELAMTGQIRPIDIMERLHLAGDLARAKSNDPHHDAAEEDLT